MPEVSYRVPGIPPGPAAGLSAFMPHFNRQAGNGHQTFKYAVNGYPGTRGVAAPYSPPGMLAAGNPIAGSMMGTSRSADAPPVIYPNQYYQSFIAERPGAGMPVQVYSPTQPGLTSLLPVPAANIALGLRRDSARLARRTILNRVRQLPWWPKQYEAPPNG